jgi:pSer/pThr/pTyr-binding forkhead associated (FHA) protein
MPLEKVGEAPAEVEDPWKGKFHLANLNEDPFLSGKIRHIIKEGNNVVGKPDKEQAPDIVIGGVGVIKGHCMIVNSGGKAKLVPNPDPNAAKVLVNGKLITQEQELAHNDRILFGSHNYFIVNDPSQPEDPTYTWDMANKEAIQDQLKAVTASQEALMQQKLKELEDKYEAEKKKSAEDAQRNFEEQLKLAEDKKIEMQKEYEEKMKQLQDKGASEEEMKKLQDDLVKQKAESEQQIKNAEEESKKQAEEEMKR